MKKKIRGLGFFFCLWAGVVLAQDLNIRVDYLIDGRGKAVKKNRVVVIQGGKISDILPFSEFKKQNKIFLDCSGHTLLPGLVDVHIHLGSAGGTKQIGAEYDSHMAYRLLKATLACGVTSIRSLCDDKALIFRLRAEERKGLLLSPRIFAVGPAFTAPGGHPTEFLRYDSGLLKRSAEEVTTPKEAVEALDKLIRQYHPDVIKAIYGAGNKQGGYLYPRLSKGALGALIARAHSKGLRVVVHVDKKKEALTALKLGADGIEHVPYGMDKEVLALLQKEKAFFVPTLAVHYGYGQGGTPEFEKWMETPLVKWTIPRIVPFSLKLYGKALVYPSVEKCFSLLLRQGQKTLVEGYSMGIKIACGSDGGNPYTFHGAGLLKEVELLVQGGLTPLQAIHCATQNGAEHLGMGDKIGTIEKGKWADLVIVEGNPSEKIKDLYRVKYVLKGGRLYSRRELDLREEYKLPGQVKVKNPAITHLEKGILKNAWGTYWYPLTDQVLGGTSSGKVENKGTGKNQYIKFSGKIGQSASMYKFSAIQLDSTARGWQTLNGSSFKGIELTLKGTPGDIYLVIGSEGVPGFYHYSGRVSVTTEWKTVKIPFKSLYRWGGTNKVPFDPGRITLFRLTVMGPQARKFEVDLREMGFYN